MMKFVKLIVAMFIFTTIPLFCFYALKMTGGTPFNLNANILSEAASEAVMFSAITSFVLSAILSPFISNKEQYKHASGVKILDGNSAIRHANRQLAVKNKFKALRIHPKILIDALDELGNLLIVGMQGSGKSTIIKYWLSQLMKRTVTMLIYDEKREYTELFFTDEVYLFCPGDERSVTWDLSKDITDVSSARTFADAVIHQTSQEPFWSESARLVVTGALMCLVESGKGWGWSDLHALLFKNSGSLQKKLEKSFPEASLFADPESRTSASVLGVISSQLSWIKYVSDVQSSNSKVFSFTDWLSADQPKKLIVQTNMSYRSMSQSLFSVALAMLTNHVLALPDSSEREVWLILDELAAIKKNDSLKRWLATGRSKGARTVGGIQAVSQIQENYGDKDAETILSLFVTVIALRTGATGQSASMISAALGKHRVISASVSTDTNGKKSVTESEQEIQVINADQLVHLPKPDAKGVEGFLTFAGANAAYRLKWPYPKLKKIASGHEPSPPFKGKQIIPTDTSARKSKNPFIQEK